MFILEGFFHVKHDDDKKGINLTGMCNVTSFGHASGLRFCKPNKKRQMSLLKGRIY